MKNKENSVKDKAIKQARTLLRNKEKAVLSTHSASKDGYPFGSVTTYMTDYQGHPIIYISHLAQHTHNIKADPKLSLIVSEDNENDINAGARLTLLGTAELVNDEEVVNISNKFYLKFPESKAYQNTHDFKFYRITVEHIRYIGGFGQIHWLKLDDFLLPEPIWKDSEKPAIEHMNEDHVDAMLLMCSYYKNFEADDISMTHLYADGCVLRADKKYNFFLPYNSLVKEPSDIRTRLVEMTQKARAQS